MSEKSSFPTHVTVRPKNLLLYDTGEVNRDPHQVIRVRQRHTLFSREMGESLIEDEKRKSSGACKPLTHAARQIQDAPFELLYVLVGVLVPGDKVAEAEDLAKKSQRKLKHVRDFNMNDHGSLIAATGTDPGLLKVAFAIDPGNHQNRYCVLCDMQNDDLCSAVPLSSTVMHAELFFYPEWTWSGIDLKHENTYHEAWTFFLWDWCGSHRQYMQCQAFMLAERKVSTLGSIEELLKSAKSATPNYHDELEIIVHMHGSDWEDVLLGVAKQAMRQFEASTLRDVPHRESVTHSRHPQANIVIGNSAPSPPKTWM
ncbi:hypothetical protein DHEL01_v212108 [Diaporthe helianthi]|uniref:Uncharacterized protein n=1 Tax=Diaporthe helianthi TaxID=158607 RepID=A0A2P5HGX5_DIAHE|nr:hypothetical protein DHEL01_v212108 [Diaporthe helianthi]